MPLCSVLAHRPTIQEPGLRGSPAAIGGRPGAPVRIRFAALPGVGLADLLVEACEQGRSWAVTAASLTKALAVLASWAVERGVELDGLAVAQPSLEDTYLELIR